MKLLVHLLDLTVLNSYIILTYCGSQTDHQKFCLTSVQNLLEMNMTDPQPQSSLKGRPNPQAIPMTHLAA
jgi:hypothetical protein